MAHLMSCALGVTPPTAKLTLRRVSYIVHVAKINLRCKYMSFILVEKVPFVKNDLQTKSNIEHTFPTKHKILKKSVKLMLRLVSEKSQIELIEVISTYNNLLKL